MCTLELDALPQKVRDGAVSKEQAAMKIMEVLYTNPCRFCLQMMSEDDRSDFLIDMLPKFESLIERHQENISPFGAYLYLSVPGLKLSWYKKRNNKAREKHAVVRDYKRNENAIYESVPEPTLLAVASPKKESPRRPYSISTLFKRHNYSLAKKESLHEKRFALILALKSAWYLNDDHINKVSDFCGFKKDIVEEKIEKIRTHLLEKSKKHSDLIEKRDKAWYFVCRYREALSNMDKDTEAYKTQKRKLEYQLHSWKHKNMLLQRYSRKISPNNEVVAKELNLDAHRVSMYISYGRRKFSQTKEAS